MIRGKLANLSRRIVNRLSTPRLSLWRTLYVNFRFLPFKQAKKLPIYIYGKTRIVQREAFCLNIKTDELRRGMILIGAYGEGACGNGGETELNLVGGTICFNFKDKKGSIRIARGTSILVFGGGYLEIQEGVFINMQCNITASTKVIICHDSRFGPQAQLHDTSFHYITDENGDVRRSNDSVVIGHHCVFGNRVTVSKGVTLPPFTIVGQNSLVTKNVVDKPYCLIAGSPARLLRTGVQRIFIDNEYPVYKYFQDNREAKTVNLSDLGIRYSFDEPE